VSAYLGFDCFVFCLCIYDLFFLFCCLIVYFCDLIFSLLLVFFLFWRNCASFPVFPHHFLRTKNFEGNISADWILRIPNQPSSKCKKHCKQFVELARCGRVMTTWAEFHFSWVYTFSATSSSLRIWATHPPRETGCDPAPLAQLHNCVDHLTVPSHIYATPQVETG